MVFYIQEGDIFNIPQIRNYAHGCNCAGAMGKGIALQFRKKYPQMYKQYKTLCREGRFGIGEIFIYQYDDGVIFNLGTQRTWKEKVQLKHIEQSLYKMLAYAQDRSIREIAMPAIGAGLGGGSWVDIKRAINTISSEFPSVDLYVVENYRNMKLNITYVRKHWEEEDITFYMQFIGEYAVRQVEIYTEKAICLSTTTPVCENSILYDQSIDQLSLSEKDIIPKDEFDKIWESLKKTNHGVGSLFERVDQGTDLFD